MPALRDLQADFVRALRVSRDGPAEDRVAALISPNPIGGGGRVSGVRHLNVHRNNVRFGLSQVLADIFPVVRRLVGPDFFEVTSGAFMDVHPPRLGPMLEYGDNFPDFLDGYPPAGTLPYLGDVARMEWARHTAYHSEDAEILDAERLGKVPAAWMPDVMFRLHPATRILGSPFPVYRIWTMNQDENPEGETILLDDGAEYVLITRPNLDIRMIALDVGGFVFLTLLHRGNSVSGALEGALERDPNFDFQDTLRCLLVDGVFRSFYVQGKE